MLVVKIIKKSNIVLLSSRDCSRKIHSVFQDKLERIPRELVFAKKWPRLSLDLKTDFLSSLGTLVRILNLELYRVWIKKIFEIHRDLNQLKFLILTFSS